MSEQQMTNEAAKTLDGWYALHDFRTMDWASWKLLSSDERQSIIHEFTGLLEKWGVAQKEGKGSQTLYSIVGQKADFMLMILRPCLLYTSDGCRRRG